MLERDFERIVPAHGVPITGGAKEAFRHATERRARWQGPWLRPLLRLVFRR